MSVILVFLVVVLGLAGWWLARQRLTSQPWLETGTAAVDGMDRTGLSTGKIALVVLLAVIGALFALFASAYFMRMEFVDWRSTAIPPIVWLNTVMLALASVALHTALAASRGGDIDTARLALVTAGVATAAFLAGQVMAWRDLTMDGVLLTSNPSSSFFYLLTAAHGLHIVVGLVAIGWITARAWRRDNRAQLENGIELCAIYAHFLFFVWIALMVVLTGWANQVVALCRQVLS